MAIVGGNEISCKAVYRCGMDMYVLFMQDIYRKITFISVNAPVYKEGDKGGREVKETVRERTGDKVSMLLF